MMYYRRKLLLALIEVFDGNLKSTDCEKLLFNFDLFINALDFSFEFTCDFVKDFPVDFAISKSLLQPFKLGV